MKRNGFAAFCEDFDVAVACLSRKRPDVLARRTDRVIHDYHLFFCGDGYDEREYHCVERHRVPEQIAGLSAVRNHVLRQLPQRIVVFVDDDFSKIRYVHSTEYVDLDPDQIQAMFVNLVVNALDLGASVFGISELDIRKSSPLTPFRLRAVVGGVLGVIGRELWFDERNKLKVDYDFCLQAMVKDRVVLKDLRYFLAQDRNTLPGGNMEFRTREREQAEIDNLIAWWGDDVVSARTQRKTIGLSVHVP